MGTFQKTNETYVPGSLTLPKKNYISDEMLACENIFIGSGQYF